MTFSLAKYIIAIFWAALFALPGIEAQATTTFPVEGFSSTARRPTVCDPGSYMVGFKGRKDRWIEQIGIICAKGLEGRILGKQKSMGPHGGADGVPGRETCDPQQIITRITVMILRGSDDRTLGGVTFGCYQIDGNDLDPKGFVGQFEIEEYTPFDQACPSGEVAVGVTVSYGADVNGLGLICDTLVFPDSGPQGFTGSWSLTSSSGRTYVLVLDVTNGVVTGRFTNSDPTYDGDLYGKLDVKGREFTYTFSRGDGSQGSGLFALSDDGMRISGRGGMNGQQFSWGGPRL